MLIDSESFALSTTWPAYAASGGWTVQGGGSLPTIVTGTGLFGANYMQPNPFVAASKPANVSNSTIFWGSRINLFGQYGGLAENLRMEIVDGSYGVQVGLNFALSGAATLKVGTTIVATLPTFTFPTNAWFYLEIGGTIASGTGGSVKVILNGLNTLVNLTGINTQGQATNTIAWVRYNAIPGNCSPATQDIYICDNTGASPCNTFLGDTRVYPSRPTANASVQFTPSGLGSNYLNAAVTSPVPATDFNAAASSGLTDLFVMASPPTNYASVFGVNIKVLPYKSDAGARALATALKSSTTTVSGKPIALGAGSGAAVQSRTIYQTDPNTGLAWTNGGVAAANVGYTVTT